VYRLHLFALRQTHSLQAAWFQSFVMAGVRGDCVEHGSGAADQSVGAVVCDGRCVETQGEGVERPDQAQKGSSGAPRDIEEGGGEGAEDEGDEGLKDFNAAQPSRSSSTSATLTPVSDHPNMLKNSRGLRFPFVDQISVTQAQGVAKIALECGLSGQKCLDKLRRSFDKRF
jgi:hypothetical protein